VAGIFQDAYFLLDTERHEQAVWMDATKWRAAVEKVGLSTRGLWSPRNRLLQTRDAPVVAVYIMACGMAVLLPIGLNRWRRRTNESSF
jgi:hypothetical protein